MKQYTTSGAASFAHAVGNLYQALAAEFDYDKAWEFVLKFYEGAGSND